MGVKILKTDNIIPLAGRLTVSQTKFVGHIVNAQCMNMGPYGRQDQSGLAPEMFRTYRWSNVDKIYRHWSMDDKMKLLGRVRIHGNPEKNQRFVFSIFA